MTFLKDHWIGTINELRPIVDISIDPATGRFTSNKEEETMKVGDKVKCVFVGLEATSTHLQVGDKGTIKNISVRTKSGTVNEYLVDFMTSDGWKRQWVYGHSIEKFKDQEFKLGDYVKISDEASVDANVRNKVGVVVEVDRESGLKARLGVSVLGLKKGHSCSGHIVDSRHLNTGWYLFLNQLTKL